jgi:hypothetical protein
VSPGSTLVSLALWSAGEVVWELVYNHSGGSPDDSYNFNSMGPATSTWTAHPALKISSSTSRLDSFANGSGGHVLTKGGGQGHLYLGTGVGPLALELEGEELVDLTVLGGSAIAGRTVYAGGLGGLIWEFAGSEWLQSFSGPSEDIQGFWAGSNDHYAAAGSALYAKGDASWELVEAATGVAPTQVSGLSQGKDDYVFLSDGATVHLVRATAGTSSQVGELALPGNTTPHVMAGTQDESTVLIGGDHERVLSLRPAD